jgi:hypothetical protein
MESGRAGQSWNTSWKRAQSQPHPLPILALHMAFLGVFTAILPIVFLVRCLRTSGQAEDLQDTK